jgi:perosamine synthetase
MPSVKHELEHKLGTVYGPEEEKAILDVLRQGAPTSGKACVAFERAFAEYCGVEHARVVTNGTAALFLAMIGIGLERGDKVITTPLTWIATAAAPATLGADVDFVDIDPATYNLDPAQLADKLTPNVKAVIPVHLYGQCCDMDPIMALSKHHDFAVVEDACHTVGGAYKDRKAGSLGHVGCFSFHEQKNMSTLGEGGIITTNDADIYERIALYRSHCVRVYGESTKYCRLDEAKVPMRNRFWWQDFDDTGFNFRMTDIQAAVGVIQLKKLDGLNAKRRENAAYLTQALAEVPGLTLPRTSENCHHVFHVYPVQVDAEAYGMTRDDLVHRLFHEYGIRVGTHYIPLHWSKAFQDRGFKRGQFPIAERIFQGLITLPVHPRLTRDALDYMIDSMRRLAHA